MPDAYLRERIENWVGDFTHGDSLRPFGPATREAAAPILTSFLHAACETREIEPAEIEEPDVRAALLDHVARLNIPEAARRDVPSLCAELLAWLEAEGRLGDGRRLAAFARALAPAFVDAASGKTKPFVRPGSRIGRNDPCPCGSGLKYKKCCQKG